MTAENPRKRLRYEASCPICLDYFADPVTLDCGHNFCQTCIIRCWAQPGTEATCPQCRRSTERNFNPNRPLANIAEILSGWELSAEREAGAGRVECERHQEPLKLFCKDDGVPICVVCDRSREHRDHNVVPVEEAAQEYKDHICSHLKILKKERENILAYKADTENESKDLLKITEAERQKAVAEFRRLRQFLEEQEQLLLAQMEEVEKEIAKKRDENMARLSEELFCLETIIHEMEEKYQQPVNELLQDIRSTLQRLEKKKFENPVAFPPELKWIIWEFCDKNPFLEGIMKEFKDTLVSGLQLQKANVILDPDTAHPKLILSEDLKSVRDGEEVQVLPDNPERFDQNPSVVGSEGFTAGRHFWEVLVGNEKNWAVGVTRKSVKRKGYIEYSPVDGIWAVAQFANVYTASNHPDYVRLSLSRKPQRIRVSLNCAGRRLAFYDADRATPLFTFSGASFSGETILPFFYVIKKAHLSLSP